MKTGFLSNEFTGLIRLYAVLLAKYNQGIWWIEESTTLDPLPNVIDGCLQRTVSAPPL